MAESISEAVNRAFKNKTFVIFNSWEIGFLYVKDGQFLPKIVFEKLSEQGFEPMGEKGGAYFFKRKINDGVAQHSYHNLIELYQSLI